MQFENNLRIKYNSIGIKSFLTSNHKKHIRGCDINDLSSQYYASVKIANTYQKTQYVKYNNDIIKLKSLLSILRYNHIKYYISEINNVTHKQYITIFNKDGSYNTIQITNTNKCLLNNKIDRKLQKKIYN